jgi:hypothetical protein
MYRWSLPLPQSGAHMNISYPRFRKASTLGAEFSYAFGVLCVAKFFAVEAI